MNDTIPSQCPECGGLTVDVSQVPPGEHDRGERWVTRARCRQCGQYGKWFG